MLHFRRTMPPSSTEFRTRTTKSLRRYFSLIAVGLALINGCAHAPEVDTVVHEAPRGSVTLERIPDRGSRRPTRLRSRKGHRPRAFRCQGHGAENCPSNGVFKAVVHDPGIPDILIQSATHWDAMEVLFLRIQSITGLVLATR